MVILAGRANFHHKACASTDEIASVAKQIHILEEKIENIMVEVPAHDE